jgi:hypothetical protein
MIACSRLQVDAVDAMAIIVLRFIFGDLCGPLARVPRGREFRFEPVAIARISRPGYRRFQDKGTSEITFTGVARTCKTAYNVLS